MDIVKLIAQADAAGKAAAAALVPVPMNVRMGDKVYHEPDGVCGFAWINIKPGFSPVAKYLKKIGAANKSYYGGVDVWVGGYGQSMQKKEAYAGVYAKVLADAGIKAYPMSRMD